MSDQVQCAQCYCTLYFTDGSYSGTTGEVCCSCQSTKDNNQFEDDYDD